MRPSCRCSIRAAGGPSRATSGPLRVTIGRGAAASRRRWFTATRPGRGHVHANTLLGGYRGILQCDGYAAYKKFGGSKSADPPVTLAFCWSHVRRGFYDLAKTKAPIATEALKRIAALYEIEARIRGKSAAERLAVRQAESKPLVADLRVWFEAQIAKLPARGPTAEAIRYALNHWDGLERFLDDGRIELDNNSVERAIIPTGVEFDRCTLVMAGEGPPSTPLFFPASQGVDGGPAAAMTLRSRQPEGQTQGPLV